MDNSTANEIMQHSKTKCIATDLYGDNAMVRVNDYCVEECLDAYLLATSKLIMRTSTISKAICNMLPVAMLLVEMLWWTLRQVEGGHYVINRLSHLFSYT